MMKKYPLVLKNSLLFLLSTLFVFTSSFVSISNNVSNFNGPIALKNSKIIVTGDSFAGKFFDFEKDKDLELVPYARAGCTIDQNKFIMTEALNKNEKNVFISIGVNDQFMETPLYRFEYTIRSLMSIALYNNKNVFFHSYLKYYSNNYNQKKFSSIQYDNIIREVCNDYLNAYYVDVKDLETPYYISDDNIHYNELFYDELYNRLINVLYLAENTQNYQN